MMGCSNTHALGGGGLLKLSKKKINFFCPDFSSLLAMELDRGYDDDEDNAEGVSGLPCYLPALMGCRNVECFEWLNRIEEGTYGVVHRAKDKKTGDGGVCSL